MARNGWAVEIKGETGPSNHRPWWAVQFRPVKGAQCQISTNYSCTSIWKQVPFLPMTSRWLKILDLFSQKLSNMHILGVIERLFGVTEICCWSFGRENPLNGNPFDLWGNCSECLSGQLMCNWQFHVYLRIQKLMLKFVLAVLFSKLIRRSLQVNLLYRVCFIQFLWNVTCSPVFRWLYKSMQVLH
jgi:hypothetical protein